jgi:hypothetical protein
MMRFRGGGVGHKSTRAATDLFKNDRDALDLKPSTPVPSESEGEGMEEEVEEIEYGDDGMNDEEEDYGYILGDDFGSESEQGDENELREELEDLDEEDFGPEDDGGAIDDDMVALGYSEL